MADARMVGSAIRRRMGAPSSHLGMADGGGVAAVHELKRLSNEPAGPNPDPTARYAAAMELRRLSAE